MDNQNSIDKLNDLIQINNDRIEGYETASKETTATDLRALFAELMQTSRQCRTELSAVVAQLGGVPTDSTRMTGKFFRAWMDVKAAFTGNDRHAILESCEFGEDQALEAYREVLDHDEYLLPAQRQLVQTQYSQLKADHDKIRSLRNASGQ